MEVHAHTHTARKKWAHYFWEFIMLFLAVFCGFLAENQREHFVEDHRAKDYAKSLLSDLRLDTSELRRATQQTKHVIAAIDRIVSISSKPDRQKTVPGAFYFYSSLMYYSFQVNWGKSTIDQLIQSGNLRYFKNKELVEMINTYYYMEGVISSQNERDAVQRDKITEIRNGILLSKYYPLFAQQSDPAGNVLSQANDSLNTLRFPLQENGEKQIDKYINHLLDRKGRLTNLAGTYYPITTDIGLEIIKTIIEEYKLK